MEHMCMAMQHDVLLLLVWLEWCECTPPIVMEHCCSMRVPCIHHGDIDTAARGAQLQQATTCGKRMLCACAMRV